MFDVGCELWEEIEDAFVSRLEIQTRIEAWTLELLKHVVDSKHRGFPTLKMVSRELDNVGYLDDGQMRLGSKLSARRFTSATACVYLRTWLVLSAVHGLLVRGERATQRGLFYSLVTCFRDQEQVNRVLKDCTQLLRCSREALGDSGGERKTWRRCRVLLSTRSMDTTPTSVGHAGDRVHEGEGSMQLVSNAAKIHPRRGEGRSLSHAGGGAHS